jgi:hypothetical protein
MRSNGVIFFYQMRHFVPGGLQNTDFFNPYRTLKITFFIRAKFVLIDKD